MTENLGEWNFGHRKTENSGHRMTAEKFFRFNVGTRRMISTNLEVIREMQVRIFQRIFGVGF